MFRLREIWQSNLPPTDEFSPDAMAHFELNGATCIVTGGFSGILRFYFPSKADNGVPYSEKNLNDPILQIEYGEFFTNGQKRLAVLHPSHIELYDIKLVDKLITTTETSSTKLPNSAYNFISIPFDGQTSPPSIIVQSLNGYITVINGGNSATYKIPHFFLPGPFTYIPMLESFIFATADYKVMCYRKMVITSKYETEPKPEWEYVFGEQAVSIHSWRISTKFATGSNFDIAVVGERTLVVLNDAGRVKTLLHHNGGALCSCGYKSSPETNKTCNNLMIACADKTVCIYVNFQKVWQLSLKFEPISLRIVNVPPNPGLVAAMDAEGRITVGYLGTHESNSLGLPPLPAITDEQLKDHMKKISAKIEQLPSADHLQIFVNISKSSPSQVEVVLQPGAIKLKDVCAYADVPLSIKPIKPITAGDLSEKEAAYHIELEATSSPPSSLAVFLTSTFATEEGKTLTKSVTFDIPFEFFVRRVEPRVKLAHSLIVSSKGTFATLAQIFPTLAFPEPHSVALVLANGEIMSISEDVKGKKYRIECDHFEQFGFGLAILRKGVASSTKAELSLEKRPSIEPFHTIVREHYNLRVKERALKKKVTSLVGELESVQKALIARYEATTPEPIDDLNTLLLKATGELKDATGQIEELREAIEKQDGLIEPALFTTIEMMAMHARLEEAEVQRIRTYIPLKAQQCSPGWEECAYAGTGALLEKITHTRRAAAYGGEVEFLANAESLTTLFDQLFDALAAKRK